MAVHATIYIPSFIKIGSGIQKLILGCGRFTATQTEWRLHKPDIGKQDNKNFNMLYPHYCSTFILTTHLHLSAEIKNGGAIPPLPHVFMA
jgi:hypothetical protein